MSQATERAGRLGAAADVLGLQLSDMQYEQLLEYLELIANGVEINEKKAA